MLGIATGNNVGTQYLECLDRIPYDRGNFRVHSYSEILFRNANPEPLDRSPRGMPVGSVNAGRIAVISGTNHFHQERDI